MWFPLKLHQLESRQGGEQTGATSQPRKPAHFPRPRAGGRSRPWASSVHVPCPLLSRSLEQPERPGEDGCGRSQTDRTPLSRTAGKPLQVFIFLRKTRQASTRLDLSPLSLIFLSDKGNQHLGVTPWLCLHPPYLQGSSTLWQVFIPWWLRWYLQCGRPGLDPWVGEIPGARHGSLPQCSCLENPMDRGAWWATVHGVPKSWTRQSD